MKNYDKPSSHFSDEKKNGAFLSKREFNIELRGKVTGKGETSSSFFIPLEIAILKNSNEKLRQAPPPVSADFSDRKDSAFLS